MMRTRGIATTTATLILVVASLALVAFPLHAFAQETDDAGGGGGGGGGAFQVVEAVDEESNVDPAEAEVLEEKLMTTEAEIERIKQELQARGLDAKKIASTKPPPRWGGAR